MTGSVIIIMFSTIYLGIHWLTDMAAGVILAITAFSIANLVSSYVAKPVSMTGGMVSNFSLIKRKSVASKLNSEKQTH